MRVTGKAHSLTGFRRVDKEEPDSGRSSTFWLVLGGCGSAVLAAGFPRLGIGFAGVALAFGSRC